MNARRLVVNGPEVSYVINFLPPPLPLFTGYTFWQARFTGKAKTFARFLLFPTSLNFIKEKF